MEIIKAKPEQAGEIAQLNDVVQKMHAENHPDIFKYPVDGIELEKFFRKVISAETTYIFMATINDMAVGYVWCEIQSKMDNIFKYGQKRVYIHQISVQPKFRNQGVGRELMLAVEKLGIENGTDRFALDSWEFNKEAHAFFEQLGFSRFNIKFWREN